MLILVHSTIVSYSFFHAFAPADSVDLSDNAFSLIEDPDPFLKDKRPKRGKLLTLVQHVS